MNKLAVIVIILGFWLLLPLPYTWLEATNQDSNTVRTITDSLETTAIPQIDNTGAGGLDSIYTFFHNLGILFGTIWNLLSLYFTVLTVGIPGVLPIINIFLLFMKIISGVTLYLLLRGN